MNRDKVEGFAKKVEGNVESAFGNVTGNSSYEAKGTANKVLGAAQSAFGKAEDYVRDSVDTVKTQVYEKPVQSSIIALAIGFILGRLLSL